MTILKKGHRLWPVLKFMMLAVLSLVVLLAVAQLALTYYGDADSVRQAFYRARWFWLVWRCVLYCVIGFGLWKLVHHPKISEPARRSLRRSALAALAFVAVSEWSVWMGGPGL
ncbi:hypothetical protein [Providencia rettgeri]|uniref:hypothetical protein n=1 Tax=Providencia rettgeri TaxID=587 RepID=UPI0024AC803E